MEKADTKPHSLLYAELLAVLTQLACIVILELYFCVLFPISNLTQSLVQSGLLPQFLLQLNHLESSFFVYVIIHLHQNK